MKTYIALLRGINVGGHKKVPMETLRKIMNNAGFNDVKTYIQSGNVVFQSTEKNTIKIEEIIQKSIQKHFSFEVAVLVKTKQEFHQIFNNSPFQNEKLEASYFIILNTKPQPELKKVLAKETFNNEEFKILDNCIFTYCSKGYNNAKCTTNFFERKLKTIATARNYRTMKKIISLTE